MAKASRFKPGDRVRYAGRVVELVKVNFATATWVGVDIREQVAIEADVDEIERFGEAVTE